MEQKRIIMNFTVPPAAYDIEDIVSTFLEQPPDELLEYCEDLSVVIEEFPDEATENDLDLDDPYELLALYKSGKEISPGVERKDPDEEDKLIIYRRPVLDMWCETGEDLGAFIRQVVIEELGRAFEFSDEDIEEIIKSYYQGTL